MTTAKTHCSFGLGMSFFRPWTSAFNTACKFAETLGAARADVPFVLELDRRASDSFEDGLSVQNVILKFSAMGWKEVRIWTRDVTEAVQLKWRAGLLNPFEREFSYGGGVVKMLALAKLAHCDYLVRTDPGCCPPPDLMLAIQRHITAIDTGYADVVSGRYDKRYAIRTDFLPKQPLSTHEEFRNEFFRLTEAFTGIVPEVQLIGGALYTCRVQGPPPPPLGAVKVVCSDDGFMKGVIGDRAIIDSNTVVPREQPGFSLSSHDYRVRLCSMASLASLWNGKTVVNAATAATAYYRAIGSLVADDLRADVKVNDAKTEIEKYLPSLVHGMERYHALLAGRWNDCLEALAVIPDLARVTKPV